jgi:antitoxin component YwqK of YwqJK toxin-antitoxin module
MKRIIITERQYKRLVDQPLNEQKTKGGKIILPRDESIYNVRDNNAKMYLLLQWVSRYLGSKYNENLHIKDISDSDLTIDLSKYKKKVINYIEYQIRSFMKVYGKILTYNKESGEMYFKDEPEEVEGEDYESFHDNGKLKTQGTIKDGLPHGEWKQYYENGQLQWQGQYVNGIMDGEWKSYHDNGQLFWVVKYVNGETEGEWKQYYDNGQLEEEGKYVNGKEEGEWKSFYDNGNVDKIEVYEDGELVDEPEGSTGCIKGDCENGQGTYTFTNGNKYVGEYKDGKPNGQGTFTYNDGDKYVGEYKDGKRNGQGTFTYNDGDKYVGEYKDGLKNGQGTYTWASGSKYVGEFKNSEFNGQGTYTYDDGSIWHSGLWKDDEPVKTDEPEEVIDVSEDTSFVLPIPNDNIKVVGRNEFLKSPANEKVDVEYVFDFFKGKGLKDYQSCGVLGNIFHESRFNTGIIGDSKKSMGIAQWHKSRLKQLSQYSKIKDKPITDKDLQLGFLWNELNGTYSYVLKELTDSTTIKEASFAWASKFEVCDGCQTEGSPTNKKRLEKGQAYLEEYSVPDDVPDIPFRNKTEGDAFRKWVNDNHKEYADKIDLDPTGHWKEGQKHFKGYMLKAWNKYGKEYVDGDYYEELEEISSNDGGCELSKCQFRVEGGGCKPFDDLSPDSKNRIGGGLNFDKIPDGKNNFRSAAPSAEQMLYILQNNPDIKKIISFDDGRDDEEMKNVEEKKFIECYNDKYGTTIKWVRVDAEKGLKSGKGYVGTLNEVLPSLDDGNNLIHCTHGADRTGYVVAKHLKDVKGWTNEQLWDYTVKYNSWEGKSGYICKGNNVKYLNYLEGFYPLSEWCKKDGNKDCPSCKNIT